MLTAEPVHVDEFGIHHRRHSNPVVIDEDFTARHPGAEVVAHRPEHHQGAAGHVLGGMLPHSFDHRRGTAVADGEALAGFPGAEELPPSRTVEDGVPEQMGIAGIVGGRP